MKVSESERKREKETAEISSQRLAKRGCRRERLSERERRRDREKEINRARRSVCTKESTRER